MSRVGFWNVSPICRVMVLGLWVMSNPNVGYAVRRDVTVPSCLGVILCIRVFES